MHNPELTKTFAAAGPIGAYRCVTLQNEGVIAQVSEATQPVLGVMDRLPAASAGDRVDVVLLGIAEVEAAVAITAPALVVSDAEGKAALPAAAVTEPEGAAAPAAQVVGLALTSAQPGEVVSILLR